MIDAVFFDWDFAGPARLARFLDIYSWSGGTGEFLDVVEARVRVHADGIRERAAAGEEAFGRLLREGISDALEQAVAELASFPR